MNDTIEKRIYDLEYVFAHLPQDLDARFAGADVRSEARADRLNIRIQALETRVRHMKQSVAGISARLQSVETRLQQVEQVLSAKLDEILSRMPKA